MIRTVLILGGALALAVVLRLVWQAARRSVRW
jgi:hypothetical protein